MRLVRAWRIAVCILAISAMGLSRAPASVEDAAPEIGYWDGDRVEVVDGTGELVRAFPDFEHFSFTSSLLAGERTARDRTRRVVAYDPIRGTRLFKVGSATNPLVAANSKKVFFLPTSLRDGYVTSVWMRRSDGAVRRIARFRPSPDSQGIAHGMKGGGGPLDLAADQRGRFLAVVFGLETLRAFDVWVVDTKTRSAQRMTRGENSHNPSLSPDGAHLAVRVEPKQGCPDPLYGEILIGKIRILARSSGETVSVTGSSCDLFYDTPRWIDNDTLLAVRVTKDAAQESGYDLDIVRIDRATGEITELLTAGNPCCITVSPDLQKVAYGFSDRAGFSVMDVRTEGVIDFPDEVSVPHLAGEGRF